LGSFSGMACMQQSVIRTYILDMHEDLHGAIALRGGMGYDVTSGH